MKDDLLASLNRGGSRMEVECRSLHCQFSASVTMWSCPSGIVLKMFQKILNFILSDVLCFESVRFY